MRQGNPDKSGRTAFLEAADHALDSHPRIDDHRHCSAFEHGKNQGKELQARFNHQDGSHAAGNPGLSKTIGQMVGLPIELPKGQMRISDAAIAVPSSRIYHRPLIGLGLRHP